MEKAKKGHLIVDGPILPGSVSTARSKCGKPNCACKADPPQLHGTYYRWTGVIDGKRTTKTITRQTALECQRRIKRFRKLQREIARLTRTSLANAPWVLDDNRSTPKKRK